MVARLMLLFLLVPMFCGAQTDSAGIMITPHLETPVGKPTGEKVAIKMNKDGGAVKSADGRVELIFPDGALSGKTTISIQPINNFAAGGVGKGYEFEPSGTTFQKPVQIIFHYRKEELDGTEAKFKNIATQHKNGKWYKLKDTKVDTLNNIITSSIRHFSSYATFDEIKINPAQARVKVGRRLDMLVTYNFMPEEDDGNDLEPLKFLPTVKWFANEVPNGNAVTGTLKISQNRFAKYTAPETVPDANPVAIAAELQGFSYTDNVTGGKFKDLTLVSNVTIYDTAYRITVIGIWKDLRREKLGANYYAKMNVGEQIITDTSSFILHVNGNKSKVTNIENMFKDSIINRGKCTLTLLNESRATGIIQIDGVQSIKVIPANPPGVPSRRFTINFREPTIVMPNVYMECKGATIGNRNELGFVNIGFPRSISFTESELKDMWAEKAGINEYQVIIKPIEDN
jgi:hypothetical protein